MLLLAGTSATPVCATAFFTEDFSGSLNANLQDPLSAYTISGGTIHKTTSSGAADRAYISTISGDYINADFVFEITLNSPNDSSSMMFVGLGSGLGNSGYGNEPQDSLYLRIHSPDFVGGLDDNRGRVDAATLTGSGPATILQQNFYALGTSPGTHRIRLTKANDALTFDLDRDYTGLFSSDMTYTVADISTTAPFINGTNSHLFFGGAKTTASWDDLSITGSVPEPSRTLLAALAFASLILRRRRFA
ncbi:hypothetical protein [Prosthecobacter sp.]|uniref:hypothetical protein n=1 Tax=Prosthecobacter sp. TaxID=1965333 RepID=UPI002ABC55E1|nr:hypothetical protein [Prosthecobacter sp.]MDZ4403125.1 hypothetical protein [Prosthecobacter sp.]